MNRKEFLEKEIELLEDKKLWGDLPKKEKDALLAYSYEYQEIVAGEVKIEKEKKTEKSKDMKNRRRRGKYGEKKVAEELDMKRNGGVGMRDVGNNFWSIEVKTVAKIPASIDKMLDQSRRLATTENYAGGFRCGRRVVYVIEGDIFRAVTGEG